MNRLALLLLLLLPEIAVAKLIPQSSLTVHSVVSFEDSPNRAGSFAIDGNQGTMWLTSQTPIAPANCTDPPYCWIIFQLPATVNTTKLVYFSNLAPSLNTGFVGNYHVYVTTDSACSAGWTEVATGTWGATTAQQKATWSATPTRCLKLESRSTGGGGTQHMQVAELFLFDDQTPPADSPSAAALSDFQARCQAAGVTACYGFDDPPAGAGADHFKDFFGTDHGVNLRRSASGTGLSMPGRDTTYRTSGAGSLRFVAPPPPHDGPDIAGQFHIDPFNNTSIGGGSNDFRENETFYVQYRRRVSSEALFNTWSQSIKHLVLYQYPEPCGTNGIGLILVYFFASDVLHGYSACGQTMWNSDGAPPATNYRGQSGASSTTVPYWLQQAAYNCQYNTYANCFYDRAEEWLTYYCKFGIGTYNAFGTTLECWFAPKNATSWTKFIDVTNFYLTAANSNGFNSLQFLMYMTGIAPTEGDAGISSAINYDELIISTQPIAIPAVDTGSTSLPGQSGGGKRSGGARR